MKIAWLVNNINQVGGIEQVICGLSNFFVNSLGYQVEINSINTCESNLFFDLNSAVFVRHYGCDYQTQTRYSEAKLIRKILKQLDADFLLTCHPHISSGVLLCKREFKGKIIITQHNANNYYTSKRFLWNALLFRFADEFVVLTKADQDEYAKFRCKSVCIPNALFNPPAECAPLQNKVLLAAGRLEDVKGFDRLISAFAEISSKYPEWKLCICGDGSLAEPLKRQTAELGITNQVVFTGFVHNLSDYMQNASCFALTSHSEGFSLVLIEAMSHGLPIISFDLPAAQEICGNNSALLVPQDDIKAFTNGLDSILASQQLRSDLSKNARMRSFDYGIREIGRQWRNLFERVTACQK